MKKTAFIFLLGIFAFNLAGYYLIFPLVSWSVKTVNRTGMERGIFQKDLVLIKIPLSAEKASSGVFAKTDDSEFSYHGKMYDVDHREVHGDYAFYYCYNDKDEEALNAGLDDHLQADTGLMDNAGQKSHHDLAKKPLKEYLKTGFIIPTPSFKTVMQPYQAETAACFKAAYAVSTPPPEPVI